MSLEDILTKSYFHFIPFLTDGELYYTSALNQSIYNITKQGFVKNISFSDGDSHQDFIQRFNTHLLFINHITLVQIIDPFDWLPIAKEKLSLNSCVMTHNPTAHSIPEIKNLQLIQTGFKQWDKLPNLKILYYNNELPPDLTKIPPGLEIIIINCKGVIDIMPLLACKNLKYLITNGYVTTINTDLSSLTQLRVCIIPTDSLIIGNNVMHVNLGHCIENRSIKAKNFEIDLYDITKNFSENYKFNWTKVKKGYHCYTTLAFT